MTIQLVHLQVQFFEIFDESLLLFQLCRIESPLFGEFFERSTDVERVFSFLEAVLDLIFDIIDV